MNDYYRHDIDQFIIQFPEGWVLPGISWYGMMYLLGFVAAYFLLEHLRKTGFSGMREKNDTMELLNYCVFGVIIGGRLGHFLFYEPMVFINDPVKVLRIWEGGMASHGGMIGVIIAIRIYVKKFKFELWRIIDSVAMATLPGLFFGRIGNFINGEMPGKPTDVSWAVIFPQTDELPRHPVQLYQALGEGLFVALVLWFLLPRKTYKPGFHSAVFLIVYGAERIVTEAYRETSNVLASFTDTLTQGQVLSIVMMLIGVGLMRLTQDAWLPQRVDAKDAK